jgi:two-component system NtrC family sensor kinase
MVDEIRILCVDDEQNVLNALKRLLFDEAYTILTACTAQAGIEILEQQQGRVQLVISDFRMPSLNGVEFLREVYKRWPDTVRIVLSGYADASTIVSAINEGHIYKFIPKPWNDDEMKVTISNSIERYFLFKKNRELTEELRAKNDELGKLLEIQSRSLEYRSRSLSVHHALLDAMPVGIFGVDSGGMIVMCNSFCLDICFSDVSVIGHSVAGVVPEDLLLFMEKVKTAGKALGGCEINGRSLRMIGSVIEDKGLVIVFIPGDICL